MGARIVILPSAKSDIESAFSWYEDQQPGLGRSFKSEVIKAIDSISDPVIGYASVYSSLCRVFVKRFPYVVYFKMDSARHRMVIYAVLNEKQNRNEILPNRI